MAQVITGAKGKVVINTANGPQTVGFVGGINANIEYTLTDVDVMGRLDVFELAETGHKVNFSVNYFKPTGGETAQTLGFDLSGNGQGIAPMLAQTPFNVEILDTSNNDASIMLLENCKFEGGSGQVDARGLWNGTWNFRAQRGYGL